MWSELRAVLLASVVVAWMLTIPDGMYVLSNQFRHDLPRELAAGLRTLTSGRLP